ncbi:hypothetical protein HAX54_037176 [Datura stramonium]|uniref:Uncharacterized protein n=1 Tax=Datura stramonium TaxID=4076 RepID=A0ABS8VIS4_DATST|nr:hypothetical protein [Datura stramonium]
MTPSITTEANNPVLSSHDDTMSHEFYDDSSSSSSLYAEIDILPMTVRICPSHLTLLRSSSIYTEMLYPRFFPLMNLEDDSLPNLTSRQVSHPLNLTLLLVLMTL